MELCLIGKIFGNKVVNKEGLHVVADLVQRTSQKVRVEAIGITNLFKFYFGCKVDRQRVLSGGTWNFNNQLISLLKPKGVGLVLDLDFIKVPFLIHFQNATLTCWNDNCARLWETQLGMVIVVDSCGLIGHKVGECPDDEVFGIDGKPEPLRYGEWMKAFNLRKWRKERGEKKKKPK
ncbi:hypothetical protein TorRG33x02_159690 [Trema orientale]|uniref:Uncharacterized protein n=1 Tax=Trema orientale TaxID=63057 RepID=A0A2P5ERF6_TREOI|nr:hypothetical protein TorRG33x02_159690 [Trema orientale]